MRIVFMGTPDFAVPVLEALAGAGHEIACAVTRPDRPKGRGHAVQATPVKEKAAALGIPVYQPARMRAPEAAGYLTGLHPDAIVVAAFGQILPADVLRIPPLGCVNVHFSLLPRYRGAAPIQWVILNGETETGVTTMMMDEGLDTGDILEQAAVPIGPEETGGSLRERLSREGARLIVSTLEKLENGTARRTPQTEENACYARMLDKSMGSIDWTRDSLSIERLVRGLDPWPGTYTRWEGRTLKIWSVRAVPGGDVRTGGAAEADVPCGRVVRADRSSLLVKTGDGLISVRELQPEGKKRMTADAFLRGYPLAPGAVFSG